MKLDKEKVLIAMAKKKMGRAELAAKLGVKDSSITNAFKKASTRPSTVGRYAEALGVDVADIIE
ncbi:MAG: helix-turn-helix transcriptional regulator [Lachnospiraceae bacterium]